MLELVLVFLGVENYKYLFCMCFVCFLERLEGRLGEVDKEYSWGN